MEKILSQDEVDALLKGLSDGDIETVKEQQRPRRQTSAVSTWQTRTG